MARSRREFLVLATGFMSGCLELEQSQDENTTITGTTKQPPTTQGTTKSKTTTDPEWRFLATTPVSTNPLYYDGTIYAGTKSGTLHALEEETAKHRFKFECNDSNSLEFTRADESIYVTCSDGLFEIDAENGEEKRSISLDKPGPYQLTVGANYLYVNMRRSSELIAVEKTSGQVQWSKPSPSNWGGSPTEAGDVLIASDGGDVDSLPSDRSVVYCFDPDSGDTLWKVQFENDALVSSPRITNDEQTAILTGRDGTVAAFDVETGDEKWRTSLKKDGNVPPYHIIHDDIIYTSTIIGGVYAIDVGAGKTKWHNDTQYIHSLSRLSSNEELVFFGGHDNLHGFNRSSGKLEFKQSFAPPKDRSKPAFVTENWIYFVTGSGTLLRRERQNELN